MGRAKRLPKQVQASVALADSIHAAMTAQETPAGAPAAGEGAVVELVAPVVETPPETPPETTLEIPPETPAETPAETPPGTPAEIPPETPPVATEDAVAALTQKYKSLQGVYASERRRAAELTGRIEGLETMLAQMQELKVTPAEPEPASGEPTSSLSEDEVQEYGEDLISMVKRAAQDAVRGEMNELRAENARLQDRIGGVSEKLTTTDREKVYLQLGEAVTNWKDVNHDPEFLAWLGEQDVYAGESRSALLLRAFEVNDAPRVIRFFQGFLNEKAALLSAAPATPPSPAPASAPAGVSLAALVSPGAGAPGEVADTPNNQVKTWKESDITLFYNNVSAGLFKGRDDEYNATEQSIQAAMQSGAILVGQ